MPRFFLHIRNGEEFIVDPDGSELPDLAAAKALAILGAREILAENLVSGETLDGQQIEIYDEKDTLLEIIPFKTVFSLPDDHQN
jgi:hypothetical protein